MVALLLWKEPAPKGRQKAIAVREVSILHTRFLQIELLRRPGTPETILRRRVLAAGKRLRKLDIDKVVLPTDFQYQEQLKKCDICPVSTLALRKALAADWVQWGLSEKALAVSSARVAVTAAQLTGEVVRTVTELALRHRYVLLDLPNGGDDLARQLRREYGVSLLLEPSREQIEGAEALVMFDEKTGIKKANPVVVSLRDESIPLPPLSLPSALEELLPTGVEKVQLLSVLRQSGALRAGQVVLDIRRETPSASP